jgi:hypothetical protein
VATSQTISPSSSSAGREPATDGSLSEGFRAES